MRNYYGNLYEEKLVSFMHVYIHHYNYILDFASLNSENWSLIRARVQLYGVCEDDRYCVVL